MNEIDIEGLNTGIYTVNITSRPDDTVNYNNVTKTTTVSINKIDAEFTITPANATAYNKTVTIGVVFDDGIEGSFNVTIYDQNEKQIEANINITQSEINIRGLNLGTYTVNITSRPDDTVNYNNVTKTTTITITKADAEFTITYAEPVDYNKTVIIGVALDDGITGSFNATVYGQDGNKVSASINCGRDEIAIEGLNAGLYAVNITCVPDDTVNYNNVTKTTTVTVNKIDANFTITEADPVDYNKTVIIGVILDDGITGSFNATVYGQDGNKVSASINCGRDEIAIEGLNADHIL